MSELLEILLSIRKEQEKYFKNYLDWAKIIKKETEKLVGKVKMFIFGSILRKNEVPRDIDVLIVSPKFKSCNLRRKVRIKIWRKIGFFAPFEIHLITPSQFRNWYSHFIKEKIEV